jgi:very-short-patch-repair endonuclease
MTLAEIKLWNRLRRCQIHGVQFYRQKPIGPYIVDFYAPSARLVIEVDGSQHLENDQRYRDLERAAFLGESGLQVLRFDNRQVLVDMELVMQVIEAAVSKIPPHVK